MSFFERLPARFFRAARVIRPASRPLALFGRRNTSTNATVDVTGRLQADLKTALKAKDSSSAVIIRSVLSEVYAAQKQSAPATLKQSDVVSVIRKAQIRRLDSAKQFEDGSRPDLARQERIEAEFLATYLPAALTVDEIDKTLRRIITAQLVDDDKNDPKKAKGLCLKSFYSQVDKNTVDGKLVKERLDSLWSQ